jgi:hypothetical protein
MIGQFEAVALRRDERRKQHDPRLCSSGVVCLLRADLGSNPAMSRRSIEEQIDDVEMLLISLTMTVVAPGKFNMDALNVVLVDVLQRRERDNQEQNVERY